MVAGMPPPRCNCNDPLRAKACPVHPCPSCAVLRAEISALRDELKTVKDNAVRLLSTPCIECADKEERIKRMQDYFGDVTITAKKLEEAEAALSRYREAVEWALDNVPDDKWDAFEYEKELRRRAGEG